MIGDYKLDFEYGYVDGQVPDERRETLTIWGCSCAQMRALLELQVRLRLFSEVRVGSSHITFVAGGKK